MPSELTFDGNVEILERTLIRNWVSSWLKYLHWYHTVALSPDPNLEDLLNVPVVETNWKGSKQNDDLFRFGLIWKVYDMVTIRGK